MRLGMSKTKTIWITGASSGIGKAIACQYATQQTNLILSSRDESALCQVREACVSLGAEENDIFILPFDVTDESVIDQITETARKFTGRIDLLINNAGISQRSTLLNTHMSTYRKLFDIDVFAPMALTKAVLPFMIEQGAGHIAVTASVAGKFGVPFRTGYSAAKHAVMGFFDALRTEVAQYNIFVTTFTPGYIKTNISRNAISGDGSVFGKSDEAIDNGMPVDDCAKTIVAGLESGKKEIAVGNGIEMKVLWLKRLFPNLVFKLMEKQYQKIAQSNNLNG